MCHQLFLLSLFLLLYIRVCQCAMDMQRHCGDYSADEVRLTFKVAIAAGELYPMHIGDSGFQIEFLLAGEPLRQIAPVANSARAGSVCVSKVGPALNDCLLLRMWVSFIHS